MARGIQELIDAINNDREAFLKIEQNEDGYWEWYYLNGMTGENETGFLHDSPEDAIHALLVWLAFNLRQHDDLIFNAVTRNEKWLANSRLNDAFPQPKLDK
ncbi:hypothetical protein [Nostoc sp. DedSLP04]|uniref:hypothetical protein n=1 Tax=Nostoc sp. DedSLP04 TaxID=3075401 RepID=UPI002AD2167C|nr:hypothetical protein [Nostoc sp. DedSLP04]MDZ8034874.1 hypothetical protein [Nostoc sp. DedSLP04]